MQIPTVPTEALVPTCEAPLPAPPLLVEVASSRAPASLPHDPKCKHEGQTGLVQTLKRWQSLIGALIGSLLAFAAAVLILWIERMQRRDTAFMAIQTGVRVYRTATLALLQHVVDVETRTLSLEEIRDRCEISLRYHPRLPSNFEIASMDALGTRRVLLDRLMRFVSLAQMLETSRINLERDVLELRQIGGTVPPDLLQRILLDLLYLGKAASDSHKEGQLLQRELNRWYLLPGAERRRLRAWLAGLFKRRKLPDDVEITKDWDVVPKSLSGIVEKHSPR
jgi:hypothetical protein